MPRPTRTAFLSVVLLAALSRAAYAAEPAETARKKGRRGSAAYVSARRLAWGMLFATFVAVCMVPIGCGASDDYAVSPQQGTLPSLPATTVDELVACAREGVGRLEHNAYEIRFDIDLDGEGAVRRVIPGGTRLDDKRLEGCMMDALRAMPSEFLSEGAPSPLSSSLFPRHARGLMGSVTLLPQIVELAPIVIASGGVTIVVTVAILVVAAAVSLTKDKPTKEECDKEWEDARKNCREQLKIPGRKPRRGMTGGYTDVELCAEGLVTPECGGTPVDHGNKNPRPGMRY